MSASVNAGSDREREHERETQRAKNGMVWDVIRRTKRRIQSFQGKLISDNFENIGFARIRCNC